MNAERTLRVSVLDMQPIEPAVGGGRLRLIGLYHALGENFETHYVGTYDWRGPGHRRQMLSQTLEELLIPLSEAHFAAAEARAEATGGRVVIDSTFPEFAPLSPEYVTAAREAAAAADVVVFSHPWVHPLVRDVLDPLRQLVIYDAHNVEAVLRMELLDDGSAGTAIVRDVIRVERELCERADLILTCSHEDRSAFNRLYDIPFARMRVFPNGTFAGKITPPTVEERAAARQALNLGPAPVAFFIGSNYAPNAEAARFIADVLAPALPHVSFVIAGGVAESFAGRSTPFNLRVPGLVYEEARLTWLRAADLAINPMFGGSGTNIKMLDYMAAGLPIVTTAIGARGIETSEETFQLAEARKFPDAIGGLLAAPTRARTIAKSAREQASKFYSWERISRELGDLLWRQVRTRHAPKPLFSVIVPTYERHALLSRLANNLAEQCCRDFEVIVVDQSAEPWLDRDRGQHFDLHYIHTDLKGPGFARNTGAKFARGKVLGFVDDDCEPFPDWLEGAAKEFRARDIVGLEGLITSARNTDPDWRAVTNEGFEALGFMTANLFLMAETFHAINGFDIAFGDMPFREDTDLGWRAQELGAIPFSRRARVYHPPQPRAVERESLEARSRFFERDALLLRKHPAKYAELMRREAQWASNPHFWRNFFSGIKRYGVQIPEEVLAVMPRNVRAKLG
ncbi:MAG TPA: glycosyltransferase [Rhizomicrobium sp.]|jgi:glycosyltransferase involved in cell wall biosynthesis